MTLQERIEHDFITAYKAKDALRTGVLRLLKTAAKNRQIEKMAPLSEEDLLAVVRKEAKQRRDSIEQYRAANRNDLADREQQELDILEEYLPKALTDAELNKLIAQAATNTGASALADMGKMIREAMKLAAGRADGGRISAGVKKYLQGGNE
ncbi:MAG: GatB/YqeY domain-containing protein [Desulfovibrionaceae bacterium]|nr:GatB/YqeY domain-containing protein [Desulfovibrionaceae bacterium]